ncbi:tRNA (adenosine(37)-N6)-threonylcarbamoyltransferase complex transferase subunit TsaD [Nitratiruptor sp. SB155-2]|uniref:tRNA N6-adenosine threonylcarbamoyltransferase n=1 Tax=Nitratiruptor sp. (strain SB155-2) TaxID=387092 RepID=TSAD_NITSB|nr:tRNA (adenosine(37)-N6)-threonylcarbamoyltransferase complex transferase subunit TsaD [Nitratiruptor sp. SB155-2]A6Q5L0.1 RecName: Full=tRNA N6-adenosine threonylcarbamoyltransferase; AltName: Full=N6-L-threonylcarbamoyladenine synthase; Short=t(6)A synthase; AltName: Full=t(6)A37 threonylcarbamoyladenosine biosynthesis protein TsaD; AltName: Full=tRNA threonylcarbamoyladenosine biosynthesis protein TsaD [Nitratiruptor sp. SB155-2]BAF70769.1 O-sialoglycoprotein endopeptidase [Nitratiruptor sp.
MILSIESSCDDSSIAITRIKDYKLLFHKKISQELAHSEYGGVVPELASRLHAEALPKILEEAKEFLPQIKAIAVTNEPGLSVTLLEGIMMAKALHLALNVPLIGVNHLIGHVYSLFIEKEAVLPKMVLLVSGGHTMILDVKGYKDIKVLATTLDDSFGESFDKVAKMMGLGYPGGPVIEKLAQKGDANRFDFPIPLKNAKELAFSYSGLKNAVRLALSEMENLSEQDMADIAASFQKAAIAHLLQKTKKACEIYKPSDFAIVGGASANMALRKAFEQECAKRAIPIAFAKLEYCSDNAAMIGRAAVEAFLMNDFTDMDALVAIPRSCFV